MCFRFTVGVLALCLLNSTAWSQELEQGPADSVQELPAPTLPPLPAAELNVPPKPLADGEQADGEKPDGEQPDGEHLTRGPVHEAFAERVDLDPQPSPVIARKPPEPVNEIPPEIKPQGSDVQWIPGYWAWDDEREDFLWVSGVWRKGPPGRRWEPGYWTEVDGGYRWVSGTWAPADESQLALVPQPPDNLDEGPNRPAPSNNDIWIPGNWTYDNDQYSWRPGFWSSGYDNWVWVPERYQWTPGGYAYCAGYWDYPLTYRGYLFAPYAFNRPVYGYAGYWFTPRVLLSIGSVFSHLWVRPYYRHYYFGNYYHDRYRKYGYHAWHNYHRRHYSPLLAHYDDYHRRHGIDYKHHRSYWHDKYAKNPHLRPHHVYGGKHGKHDLHGKYGKHDLHGKYGKHGLHGKHAAGLDGRHQAAVRRDGRFDGGSHFHARHRLDQYPQGGQQRIATRVDDLRNPNVRNRDSQARRAVFLQEQQRRAIGNSRQQEVRRMVERRKQSSRARLASGSAPSQQGQARRTLKPTPRDAGRLSGPSQAVRSQTRGNANSQRSGIVEMRGRTGNAVRQRANVGRGSSPATSRARDVSRSPGSVTRPDRGPTVTPQRGSSAGRAADVRAGRGAAPRTNANRGPSAVRSSRPPARANISRGPVASRTPSRANISRPNVSRPSATRGPSSMSRGPSRSSTSRGPSSISRGPSRSSISRGPSSISRGPSRSSISRGPSSISRGPSRSSMSRGPSRSSISRGPSSFSRGPSRSSMSRGPSRSSMSRGPSSFSRGPSRSSFSRGGGRSFSGGGGRSFGGGGRGGGGGGRGGGRR